MDNLITLTYKQIKSTHYQKSIELILQHKDFPNIERVKFALMCAQDLDKFYDFNKYPEIKKTRDKCLELVADYILSPNSKKPGKLSVAANAANAAGNAANAANAAYAAANAAGNAANAANAAYAAAYAANAAGNAAYAAANAAYAAANVANAANAAYAAANAAYAAAYAANAANAAYNKQLLLKLIKQVLTFTNSNSKLPKLFYM